MKRGRRKGGNKDKVFGCDLLEHLSTTNQEIPQVLRSCSEFIEEHGIVDGIYRLSGVSSNTQKLRSEFDIEGTPDLYKDLYLQDIHCVSSLCKAYFRELPNPLLTYQLYDHFAEAVAVQLEGERLVKIKDVLKELPILHYKTLEYLMKHLVRMSKHSDQTNMHARNLAIVWAPNLLRSKDIEASGFNGTAAFMEVRVQSIVVEFILTHVAQLFPDSCSEGLTLERRKSLPSPTGLSGQEDQFFKAIPFQCPGNMSPGDGPPPMRPYHAIIDGTDKRKGSLKGRKWRSIFNLGGRLQDPRKKNKYTTKEKEKTSLRPAKSMDSLSSGPYTLEDSRHPSSHLSPLVPSSGTSEGGNPSGGGVGSGYAVTYRRTGGASVSMVSGGSGTQGTYKSLDVAGTAAADRSQAASQGAASKAERRAGMHISGPFSVTVPLHITSGLALGVLHGGRNEEEQSQQSAAEEEQSKEEKAGEKDQPADGKQEQTEQKTGDNQGDIAKEVKTDKNKSDPSRGEEENEAKAGSEEGGPKEWRESQDEEDNCLSVDEESSKIECVRDRLSLHEDTADSDYMVMKPGVQHDFEMTPNPQYMEEELPLDFQDTFGFLDLMDTSVQTSSNQFNEFSVEPPGFEEEEEEEEDGGNDEQNQSPPFLPLSHLDREKLSLSSPNVPHRPLPGKSHSLPYKSLPFLPAQSSSSEEEDFIEPDDEDEDASYSDKDEYEDMFCKSLPSACHFQELNWTCTQTATTNNSSVDSHANTPLELPDQTHNIEVTKGSPDSPPINQSENLSWTDNENILDNRMDTHTIDQSLNKDLSPLPLETLEQLSMDENKTEDKSTEDAKEESGSEKTEHRSEPVQKTHKVEGTDCREDTQTCCQEETQYMDNEDEEDTYFGPDATSTSLKPDNNEKSHAIDKLPIEEELTVSVDSQQPTPEGCSDIEASEVTLTDEPVLLPGTTTLASPEDTNKLSIEQTLTLHKDKQGQTDDSEVRDDQSKTSEVGKEVEELIGNISVTEENSVMQDLTESEDIEGEEGKEEASTVEVKCKTSNESDQEHERVDRENREEVEEKIKHQVDKDVLQKETEMTEGEQTTILGRNEKGVLELTIRKWKEEGDQGEESDGQIEGETEARKESHLGETEIKEGSVPEERMVREVSEDDNRLSENSDDSTESVSLLEEPQGKTEDERENEALNADEAILVVEKSLRPPRMKELEAGKDVSLGPGVSRTVLKSKQAPIKVYQAKAVPVVPPKPQHSKITAFKQQFQHRDSERLHLDRGLQSRDVVRNPQQGDTKCCDKDKEPEEVEKEEQNNDHQKTEQGRDIDGLKEEENKTVPEKIKLKDTPSGDGSLRWEPGKGEDGEDQGERRGTGDGGSWRKDGQKELDRETKRASGISICFDEAVARATGKRCREKEDKFIDLQREKGEQKEGLIQRKREEEGETD